MNGEMIGHNVFSSSQHSLLDNNILINFKIEQTWNTWQTYVLHRDFVKT